MLLPHRKINIIRVMFHMAFVVVMAYANRMIVQFMVDFPVLVRGLNNKRNAENFLFSGNSTAEITLSLLVANNHRE